MTCPHCDSNNLKLKATRTTSVGEARYQYLCGECGKYHTTPYEQGIEPEDVEEVYTRDEAWFAPKLKAKTFVITSAQSNSPVNDKFLDTLLHYCDVRGAELFIVPIKYGTTSREHHFDEHIREYIVENNVRLHANLRLLGSIRISATAENPLTGLAAISQGDSIIVGHNQLQLTTLPVGADDHPVIMSSTGTISEAVYSETKSGYKAGFNHAYSAVVVELDGDIFHIRHLNWDGESFHDLAQKFTGGLVTDESIEALVTGDEHAIFFEPSVYNATYGVKDSITSVLKPKQIVRHDLLDCYAVSHHHKQNPFIQFAKNQSGMNRMEDELEDTIDHVVKSSPAGVENIIVSSNHNDHLTRWLMECEPKEEPWNAILYHSLMLEMLKRTTSTTTGTSYPSPFELYSTPLFKARNTNVRFVGRREVFKIKDIEVANHGDKGSNGSRGSRKQFSQLPSKTIIGHSHSPGIEKGCYQVGTSSYLDLEYNNGPSSWLNTHCIIHSNGKRQLVNIIKGKWRR